MLFEEALFSMVDHPVDEPPDGIFVDPRIAVGKEQRLGNAAR